MEDPGIQESASAGHLVTAHAQTSPAKPRNANMLYAFASKSQQRGERKTTATVESRKSTAASPASVAVSRTHPVRGRDEQVSGFSGEKVGGYQPAPTLLPQFMAPLRSQL
ncbi:uncharacterized protein MAM_07558 [Metarhizium album ARSEF 1941]|uniref:Uncharacterized protein n=1 Tax=Metarhizium album (strain ARSEF 1941) TaxID=1081103 RepID=A0A0B2WMD3_METAS|nr:uncharacterized protein MAM_07558 [Metarhizium album ARSEF 1941]KHN94652.1 hypothetical protein MAM_07558 [Metarhizium album ARSEF 1941]